MKATPLRNDEFVAQQVEHNTFNVGVLGSSPSEFTQKTHKAVIYTALCVFYFMFLSA